MRMIEAWILGTAALLQHRFGDGFGEETGKNTRRALHDEERTPRSEAEAVCYRDPDGTLYHPASAIARLLREAGGAHKLKGTRKSVKYVVPAAVLVTEDTLPLYHPDGHKLTTFEVDSRPVTIPATKGRIMRHRPRHDRWALRIPMRLNEDVLPEALIRQLLVEGGMQLGLGDYRPERGGPFGLFHVVSWASETWTTPRIDWTPPEAVEAS